MADTNDTARFLRRYQQWRKGEIDSFYPDSHSGPEPKEVTAAIDAAIAALEATPPADAALADEIDSLGFVIRGDDPPVKEWASELGGGCMPATKEEKMMWDMLQAALRARAVPEGFDMRECHDFWAHYSSINEGMQDELNGLRHTWLERMLAASKEGV